MQLTTLQPGDVSHRWPWVPPDGFHYLYLAVRASTAELRVGSLQSAETETFGPFESSAAYAAGHLFFVHGANLMAQAFDAGRRRLRGDPFPVAGGMLLGAARRGAFAVSDAGVIAHLKCDPHFN
jgi:hypothetical protein